MAQNTAQSVTNIPFPKPYDPDDPLADYEEATRPEWKPSFDQRRQALLLQILQRLQVQTVVFLESILEELDRGIEAKKLRPMVEDPNNVK